MLNSFQTLMPDSDAPSLHAKCDKPSGLGFNFMEEEIELWTPIPFTCNEYDVSNFGRMRSWLKGRGVAGEKSDTPHILKTPLTASGYPHTSLYFREKNCIKRVRVHRLVAEHFVPNPHNMPHVLHKDDDKTNAHYKNLEWGNHRKNMQDAFIRKRIIPAKGMARKKSNLTDKDVKAIFKSKETCYELAKKYKVNHTCISDIRSGRSWNHITGLPCTRKIKPKFSKDIKFKD